MNRGIHFIVTLESRNQATSDATAFQRQTFWLYCLEDSMKKRKGFLLGNRLDIVLETLLGPSKPIAL